MLSSCVCENLMHRRVASMPHITQRIACHGYLRSRRGQDVYGGIAWRQGVVLPFSLRFFIVYSFCIV